MINNRNSRNHENQNVILFKGKNSYAKVMNEVNEPPKEYEAIKALVEGSINDNNNNNNNINLTNNNR